MRKASKKSRKECDLNAVNVEIKGLETRLEYMNQDLEKTEKEIASFKNELEKFEKELKSLEVSNITMKYIRIICLEL